MSRVNDGIFTTSLNQKDTSGYLYLLLMLYEYIKTQMRSQTATFMLPSTLEKGLIKGQIKVATREIGLGSTIAEFDPSGDSMSYLYKELVTQATNRSFEARDGLYYPGHQLESATIVIGGTKGIGLLFCRWATHYNARLCFPIVSLGRRGYLPESSRSVSSRANSLCISSYDCSCLSDNDGFLSQLWALHVSKCSIFYSSGVTMDTYYMTLSIQSYRTTFAPKYAGFKAFTNAITPSLPCMASLSTSSMAIDIGNIGQANYIAANIAMEILSDNLRESGLPSRWVRFGPWEGLGMLYQKDGTKQALYRLGLQSMTPRQGLRAAVDFMSSTELSASIGILSPERATLWNEPSQSGEQSDKHIINGGTGIIQNKQLPMSYGIHQAQIYDVIQDILQDVLGVHHVADDSPFFEVRSIHCLNACDETYERHNSNCRLVLIHCH